MTPDLHNLESRQDRDKRQREDELLLLLLALMSQARSRADSAIALGVNPYAAVADVLTGNADLGLRSPAPRLAARLAAADAAGFRRTVRVIGTSSEAEAYAPTVDYGHQARAALAKALAYVNSRLSQAIRQAAAEGISVRRAVRDSFEGGGLVVSATSKAWYAETVAETLVGFAYSGGWFNGFARPDVAAMLKGWRFSATLDSRTTDVCRKCHGTQLPVGHPWLQSHTPALHFRCRSVLLPLWRDFEATAEPPYIPAPAAGFGQAPAVTRGLRYTRVA